MTNILSNKGTNKIVSKGNWGTWHKEAALFLMHRWVLAHPGMAGIWVSSFQPRPFPRCHPQEEEQGAWVKWEPCVLISSKEGRGGVGLYSRKEREGEGDMSRAEPGPSEP